MKPIIKVSQRYKSHWRSGVSRVLIMMLVNNLNTGLDVAVISVSCLTITTQPDLTSNFSPLDLWVCSVMVNTSQVKSQDTSSTPCYLRVLSQFSKKPTPVPLIPRRHLVFPRRQELNSQRPTADGMERAVILNTLVELWHASHWSLCYNP
ncbi:6526_t:CDS:2, partial [Acaulospora morrowiae]